MRDSQLCLVLSFAVGLALVLGLWLTPEPLIAQDDELPMNFNVIAVNMSTIGAGGNSRLQISINRWTTGEERAEVFEALKEGGPRSLANALNRQDPVGRINPNQGLGENLRYSRRAVTDEGEQIVLALDRPLAFVEAWRSSRTRDYNVTLIVLTLDKEGRGTGQMFGGAQFSWNEETNQMVVEGFASEPIRLTDVRRR